MNKKMKKIVRLTESDLTRIVKILVEESKYKKELKLKQKLDNIFFGKDDYNVTSDEGQRGYLSQEYRLSKEISPRQRMDRIQQVIDELENYIEDLKYSLRSEEIFTQNPEYGKQWGDIEKM